MTFSPAEPMLSTGPARGRRARPWGSLARVELKNQSVIVDEVHGYAKEFKFDVAVNFEGMSAPLIFTNVWFANKVPPSEGPGRYHIIIDRRGHRVAVIQTGDYFEFGIEWLPYVLPCPGAGGRGEGATTKVIGPGGAGGAPPAGGGHGPGGGGNPPGGGDSGSVPR